MNAQPRPSLSRLKALLEERSLQRGNITLASGAEAGIYVDCKQTALHPEGALALGLHLYEQLKAIEDATGRIAAAVGGMSIGADPLATAVSLAAYADGRFLPAFLVRKEPKKHGTGAYLEGLKNIEPASDVILLEDVVTTGGSTLMAAERVISGGLHPFGVSVIIDREVGGMANLEATGLKTSALFRLSELT
ncbi:MAG: orotate phosphoribosyltransferase [Myxococcota bacterium]|nr:orotate phosphoribosyltransferase [Myxococcota bacterium]